ncbi:hypothetical protein PFLUV_G00278290 [Perca fluviatilis]|uniref:Uncharacterized protein n=1 Tax=Perca fluviatilis TaxID=8168 RepID=A0A6A5DMI5_PERFL|nr:hypothetical protein PFLUV_G00278290 [Perca fluviatilis]
MSPVSDSLQTVCLSVCLQSVPSVRVSSACPEEAVSTSPAASVSISSVAAAASPSTPDLSAVSLPTVDLKVFTPTTPETVCTT